MIGAKLAGGLSHYRKQTQAVIQMTHCHLTLMDIRLANTASMSPSLIDNR